MLTIDIRNLEEGYHEFSLEGNAEELELDNKDFRDIHAVVRMHYDSREIVATVEAKATATLVCDRTLVRFDQEISGTYAVLFSPDEADERDVEGQDEVRSFAETDEQIDVTDIVRDTLLLAIPVRKIAPGAEKAEIQTAYGVPADGAVDPRWDALAALKSAELKSDELKSAELKSSELKNRPPKKEVDNNGNHPADAEPGRQSAT